MTDGEKSARARERAGPPGENARDGDGVVATQTLFRREILYLRDL